MATFAAPSLLLTPSQSVDWVLLQVPLKSERVVGVRPGLPFAGSCAGSWVDDRVTTELVYKAGRGIELERALPEEESLLGVSREIWARGHGLRWDCGGIMWRLDRHWPPVPSTLKDTSGASS
jgi:hypothetical protein